MVVTEDGDKVQTKDLADVPAQKVKDKTKTSVISAQDVAETWQLESLQTRLFPASAAGKDLASVDPLQVATDTSKERADTRINWAKVEPGEYFIDIQVVTAYSGPAAVGCGPKSTYSTRRSVTVTP